MFIDKHLEEAIIREFSFGNMIYKGIFKDLSRNPLLIFTSDHGRCLAIYRKSDKAYKIYNVYFDTFAETYVRSNSYEINLYIKNGKTYLKGSNTIEFDGIVFNFIDEFILAKLEE